MPENDNHGLGTLYLQSLVPTQSTASELSSLSTEDKSAFLQWADDHRLTPQLHSIFSQLELSPDIATHFHEAALESLPMNMALKGASRDIGARLMKQGIDSLPFKGPELAELLYGGLSYRWCYDLDLFVKATDVVAARDILLAMGYEPEGPDAPLDLLLSYRHELGFVHPDTQCRIELHWRIVPSFLPCKLTVDMLFDKADKEKHPAGLSHLSPEESFILLAVHGNRHGWSHLCWLLDLVTMVNDNRINPDLLFDRAKALNLSKALEMVWALMSEVPGVNVAPRPSPKHSEWVSTIAGGWMKATLGTNPSYSYLAATLDTWSQELSFWSRLIFQPTVADFRMLPLPRGLRWLNALLRPLRLLIERKEDNEL